MTAKGHVLVVDDEPTNVKLIEAHLKAEGFDFTPAYDGQSALNLAKEKLPDVILLDVMMPDMDGFLVTGKLKEDPATRDIPVVLVTALDGSDNRVRGLNAGADDFLTKPVNRFELLARVRALHQMKLLQDELKNRLAIAKNMVDHHEDDQPKPKSVMIVDDDINLSKQYCKILEGQQFLTCTCLSVKSALEKLASKQPDIILLDRLLPDKDGIDFLEELKSDERYRHIPVIILTAMTDLEPKIEGIERGADDYLVKPIDHTELVARIRAGLRRSETQAELKRDLVTAQVTTVTDRLTQVRNRHYFESDMEYRIAQANRHDDRVFCVLMVDIDHFKHINDDYGHLIGDSVLRTVAQELEKQARTSDIVTRYGGEEFAVVLPETELQEASNVAERMRSHIEALAIDGVKESVTASFGISQYQKGDHSYSDIVERADQALYEAKEQGRNQVVMFQVH